MSELRIKELERKRNEIYKKAEPINKELNALRDAEAMKERQALVGKCYLFRNGDGTNHWNLYSKIVGNNDGGLISLRVEKSPSGISIETRQEGGSSYYLGEKEISPEEFNIQCSKLLAELISFSLK